MRPRDIIKLGDKVKYLVQFTGLNHSERRRVEGQAKRDSRPKKAKAKNWNRDRHKRRKVIKFRRKQSWRGKACR